jgi:hypothetical protein
MKKHFIKALSVVLVVVCLTASVCAASVSASNSTYNMSASAAMSDVSGKASTETSKLSGSSVYSFSAYVTAYASDGTYNSDSRTSYKTSGDVMATATAPGTGTPYRALCRSYFKPESTSTSSVYMINQYVKAG